MHVATEELDSRAAQLRTQFPRIVVRYDATEDGNAAKPLLPDVGTAYLTMDQVAPRDW